MMSSVVRRFDVVAHNDMERMQKIGERTGNDTENNVDQDSVIGRREHAVDVAVADINKPPDVRAKVVDQSVQEYLKARKDADKHKQPPTQPNIVTKDDDDYSIADVSVHDDQQLETPAAKLLARLTQHKPQLITWSGSGQLLVEFGQEVMGASATTLAEFAMQSRKRSLPPGWTLFSNALVQAGIPLTDIKNVNMRRAMEQIMLQDKAEKLFKKNAAKSTGKKAAFRGIRVRNEYP